MTYCIAWKKNNKLYFIADSALSTRRTINNEVENLTTFGELEDTYDQYYVYEGRNKITPINEKVVVCFSGVVSQADEITEELKERISFGLGINDAILSVKEATDCTNVSMIVGYSNGGESHLLLFDGEEIRYGEYFDIGSGSDIDDWRTSVKKWFKYEFPDKHLLSIMIALIQMESTAKYMVKYGVGGTFTGLELDLNGVKWGSDLSYVLYTPHREQLGFISVINRQNLTATSSTFNSTIKLITGFSHLRINKEEIIESIGDVGKVLTESESDYLVLTNIFRKKVVVMYIDKWLHNNLFRMWRRHRELETDYILVFGDTISDYLFTSKHGDDDEMTLHFLNINTLKEDYISLVVFANNSGSHFDYNCVSHFHEFYW